MVAMGTTPGKRSGWDAFVQGKSAHADTEVEALAKAAEAHIAELEALLREADDQIAWETAVRNGRDFQRRVEAALGIGSAHDCPRNSPEQT